MSGHGRGGSVGRSGNNRYLVGDAVRSIHHEVKRRGTCFMFVVGGKASNRQEDVCVCVCVYVLR